MHWQDVSIAMTVLECSCYYERLNHSLDTAFTLLLGQRFGVLSFGSAFALASLYSKCRTAYSNSALHQVANKVGICIFLNLSTAIRCGLGS